MDAFANGKVGLFRAEEWVIEYIRDVMTENGTNEDYGLTYFPQGPDSTGFVDESYGGNSYFIPASISNEKAQAALLVYRDLMDPSDDGYTKEERVRNTGESLFPDEASVEVYTDPDVQQQDQIQRRVPRGSAGGHDGTGRQLHGQRRHPPVDSLRSQEPVSGRD